MIDLVEKYKESLMPEINKWLEDHANELTDKNENNLKAGDTIEFLNGYKIPMRTKITAFCKNTGKAYLYWDCYWYAIDLDTRLIKQS